MKHFIRTVICLFVLTAFITIKSFSQTVYVQESGKKYHMKNCSVGGNGKKGMTIAEAKKAGYTACKVCKPDENSSLGDKPKTADQSKPVDTPKAGDKPKTVDPKKAPAPVKPK